MREAEVQGKGPEESSSQSIRFKSSIDQVRNLLIARAVIAVANRQRYANFDSPYKPPLITMPPLPRWLVEDPRYV